MKMSENPLGVDGATIVSLPFEQTATLHNMFMSHIIVSWVVVVSEESNKYMH